MSCFYEHKNKSAKPQQQSKLCFKKPWKKETSGKFINLETAKLQESRYLSSKGYVLKKPFQTLTGHTKWNVSNIDEIVPHVYPQNSPETTTVSTLLGNKWLMSISSQLVDPVGDAVFPDTFWLLSWEYLPTDTQSVDRCWLVQPHSDQLKTRQMRGS